MTNLLARLQLPRNFLLVLSFAASAVILSLFIPTASADTYWNLRAGEALWNGTFTFADQWSYTATGEFWPDHEIAFQLLLYGLWLLGGETWIAASIFSVALTLGTLWLLLPSKNLMKRFGGQFGFVNFLLIIALVYVLAPWISLRPSVLSFFFTALALRLILTNKPLWIPLVTLVWIQFHGSVILGCLFIGVAMLVNFSLWISDRKNVEKLKRFRRFLIATVGAGITLFLSPMGFEFLNYTLFEASDFRRSYILEWMSLYESANDLSIGIVVFLLIVISFAWPLRKFLTTWEGLTLAVLAGVFSIMAVDQLRVLGTVIMLAIPITMLGFAERRENPFTEKVIPKTVTAVAAIGFLIFSLVGSAAGIGLLGTYSLRNPLLPNGVREVLYTDQCYGATWNDYNSGGYLLWFEPDVKVAIDSRYDLYPKEIRVAAGVYPPDVFVDDGTAELNVQLEKYEINCFLTMNPGQTKKLRERGLEPVAENSESAIFILENHQIPADPNPELSAQNPTA